MALRTYRHQFRNTVAVAALLAVAAGLWPQPSAAFEDDRYTSVISSPKNRPAPTEIYPDDDGPQTTAAIPARDRVAVAAPSESGLASLKSVIDNARSGRIAAAKATRSQISDPVIRAVADWAMLRRAGDSLDLDDHLAFLHSHGSFPGIQPIQKRVEALMFDDKAEASTVSAYFGSKEPSTAKGKLALARALKTTNPTRAHKLVREVWRTSDLSKDAESFVLDQFGSILTRADHRARMDRQLLAGDDATALRVAQRLGAGEVRLAQAVIAVISKSSAAAGRLQAVPASLHSDPAYQFARIQLLRRQDKHREAAQLMLAAPRDPALLGAPSEWWTERRILARKMLDNGEAQLAYRLAAGHSVQDASERVEAEFHAGWIALRFLKDHAAATRHFEQAAQVATTPMSRSRAHYWLGRAQESAGQSSAARASYTIAAQFSAHYYGQLARARVGLTELPVRRPHTDTVNMAAPAARAVSMLYQIGERDLARAILADLGQRFTDQSVLNAAAMAAAKAQDAKGVLTIGKLANNRGLPFDVHAFPTIGIPQFTPVGPQVDRAVVFAIARQESTFDPGAVSHAGARGLLQLMPATARQTARSYGVGFDAARLSDPAYNAKIGAAHLGELVGEFGGSYILTFASYNAGRSRAKEWMAAYGDPRDPKVDPVDWVERIPFSETRNYVQRVMENVQVYRALLSQNNALRIEADLRRGSGALR